MFSNKMKRCFSFLMAMLMLISLMPVSVLATEEDVHDHSTEVVEEQTAEAQETVVTEAPNVTEDPVVTEDPDVTEDPVVTPNPEIEVFQEKIDLILMDYLGTSEVNAEEVPALCARLTAEDLSNADFEILCLDEELTWAMNDGLFTEAEAVAFVDRNPVFMAFCDYVTENCVGTFDGTVYATTLGTHTPVTGITVKSERTSSSGTGTSTHSGEKVTVTAIGYKGGFLGSGKYAETVQITVSNSGENTATVKFDWTATSVNQLKIDGTVTTDKSGSFDRVLASGSSVVFEMTTAKNGTSNKLELYNFDYQEAAASSKVTFKYNTSYGSVKVGEETLTGTTEKDIPSTGVVLAATASSGKQFLGWMNEETHEIVDSRASFTFMPPEAMTLVAVFTAASDPAWFIVNGNTLYQGLNEAVSGAGANGGKLILATSGKLPALKDSNGQDIAVDYTIPANVSVVIPYKADDTGTFSEKPTSLGNTADGAKIANRAAFRTLTVADNVTINCAGKLNPNAIQYSTSTSNPGGVMNGYGLIKLDGANSRINVTGTLYCYGYIIGTGTVNVASGGKVYEFLQLTDWRGGQASEDAISKDLFPFSQYYAQNVEANLVINSGATAYVCVSLEAGLSDWKSVYQTHAAYMGGGGLFQLGAGAYVKRSYDTSNDRIRYTISGGNVVMDGMELSLSDYSMNTTEFIFALTSNISVEVDETATLEIKSDIKLLPNTEVILNGATTVSGDLYLYDYADWNAGTYVGSSNVKITPIGWIATTGKASGRTLKATSASLTVNDTLTVTGGLYSSSGKSSADKVLKGTGTLVYTPTGTATSINEGVGKSEKQLIGTKHWVELSPINVSPVVANLAGDGDLKPMPNGTYIGLGSNHGNKWYINKTVVAPDCVNAGSTKYYCSSANAAYSVAGAAATGIHTDTNPEDGICDVVNCKAVLCTHENTEPIAGKAATCTATGLTEGAKCSKCGTVTKAQTSIPVNKDNHPADKIVDVAAVAPTCTEPGLTAGKQCSACKVFTVAQTTVAVNKDNHPAGKIVDVVAVAPTCTATGLSAGKQCSACKVFTVEQAVVEVDTDKGHKYTTAVVNFVEGNPAKYTVTVTCNVCADDTANKSKTSGELNSAKSEKAGDCLTNSSVVYTADGTFEGVKYNDSETVTGEKGSHNMTYHKAVSPTCIANGNVAFYNCSVCGNNYKEESGATKLETTLDPATGVHSYTGAIKNDGATHSFKCVNGCEEYGNDTAHVYDQEVATDEYLKEEASCTEQAVYYKSCECGAKGTDTFKSGELAAHVYDKEVAEEQYLKSAATCTAAAVYYKSCSCGEKGTETFTSGDPLAHTYNQEKAEEAYLKSAATCTARAVYYKSCSCGAISTNDADTFSHGNFAEHSFTSYTKSSEASCGINAKETATCDREGCKETHTREIENTALQHKFEGDYLINENGTHSRKCTNSGCTVYGNETDHTFGDWQKTGNKHWKECACGAKSEEAAHTYEKEVTPPSFTAGGYTTYTCSTCNFSYKGNHTDQLTAVAQIGDDQYQTLAEAVEKAKSGDTIVLLADAQGATGFAPMDLKGATLSLNGKTLTGSVAGTVQMNGGTLVTYADDGAPITMAGPDGSGAKYITENAVFVLGSDWSMTVESGEASLGQNWQTLPKQKVTIGTGAVVSIPKDTTFTIRGTVIVEEGAELTCEGTIVLENQNATLTIAKIEGLKISTPVENAIVWYNNGQYVVHFHTAGEAVVENEVAATCTAAGSFNTVVYCTVCGAEVSRETTTVPATGHTAGEPKKKNEVDPTCTEAGSYDLLAFCTVCGLQVSKETVVVEALGHQTVTKDAEAATCTETGLTEGSYCSACNVVFTEQTITPALGHDYKATVTAPTCTEGGYTTHTCSRCNDSYVDNEIAATGHSYGEATVTKEPTCEAEGEKQSTCSVCRNVKTEKVSATGHSHTAVVTKPTCTEGGYTTYTCHCGDTYVDGYTEPTGHTEEVVAGKEPTCTEDGLTQGKKCSVCGTFTEEQITIGASGHTEETIPAVDATCTSTGLTEGKKCSECGEVLLAQEETPMLEHAFNSKDSGQLAKAASCTAKQKNYVQCDNCTAVSESKTVEVGELADHTVDAVFTWDEDVYTCTVKLTCGKCNEVLVETADCTIDEQTEEATCGEDGKTTYTASYTYNNEVITNTETKTETIPATGEHTYVDGVCSGCGDTEVELLEFVKTTSVDLGNSLSLLFIVDPDFDDDNIWELIGTDNYAVISKLENGVWTAKAEVPQSEWGSYSKNRLSIPYDDITAMQMTDKFKVVIYNKNREAVSTEYEDSVRNYAMRGITTLAKDPVNNAKRLTMFVDFLNYGAAAQINFHYNTDDLANSELTAEQQQYATPSATAENKREGDGSTNVNVESRIELGFAFAKTDVNQDMYAIISYTHFNGTAYNKTVMGTEFESYSKGTKWRIPVYDLTMADCNQMITCTVYDADGNQIAQAKDSVNSYMSRVIASSNATAELKALANEVLKLSVSAYAWFTSK